MAAPRQFRYIKPQVGAFVLGTVILALAGIYFAAHAQGWFEPRLTVQATLPDLAPDSTLGMKAGTEIQVYGISTGTVSRVRVVEAPGAAGELARRLQLTLVVRGEFRQFVRADSEVLIKRKFGVAGSPYVQITAGAGGPVADGTELPCSIAPDLMKLVEDTLNDFRRPDSPVQQVMRNAVVLTSNLLEGKGPAGRMLSDPETAKSIQATLQNIEKISLGVTEGRGLVGKLLTDPETATQVTKALGTINETLTNVNGVIGQANTIITQITTVINQIHGSLTKAEGTFERLLKTAEQSSGTVNAEIQDMRGVVVQVRQIMVQVDAALKEITLTTSTLRQQTQDLPGVLLQTQEMMRQTTRTLEAVQQTWLLRDFVPKEGAPRLSPDMGAP